MRWMMPAIACLVALLSPPIVEAQASYYLSYGGVVGPATQPTSCIEPVVSGYGQKLLVQRLGQHMAGETVRFPVPPLTGTISIIQQAVGADPVTIDVNTPSVITLPNAAPVTTITEPNGTVIYTDNAVAAQAPDLSTAHVIAKYPAAATGVVTLPNTTQALTDTQGLGYPPGLWSVKVNDYAYECASQLLLPDTCSNAPANDRYDLTVVTKPIAHPIGTLNVAVYYASQTTTAQKAYTSASFKRFGATLSSLYAQVGVYMQGITLYDLPSWATALYAQGVDANDTGPCSNFGQLFTLSTPGDQFLNLFFVDAITQGSVNNGEIVGIDPSIPGPSALGGTIASGAVVNFSDLAFGTCGTTPDFFNCGADLTAYISAHEGGHFMGLYHTTEAFGQAQDPLADTPTCACTTACVSSSQASACATDQATLSVANCTQTGNAQCGGGDNLMFWSIDIGSLGTLSPQQGKVMRANPLVQ